MKIVKKEASARVLFQDLKVSDLFCCDGKVYMKTDVVTLPTFTYNCVNLETGTHGAVSQGAMFVPFNGSLVEE